MIGRLKKGEKERGRNKLKRRKKRQKINIYYRNTKNISENEEEINKDENIHK